MTLRTSTGIPGAAPLPSAQSPSTQRPVRTNATAKPVASEMTAAATLDKSPATRVAADKRRGDPVTSREARLVPPALAGEKPARPFPLATRLEAAKLPSFLPEEVKSAAASAYQALQTVEKSAAACGTVDQLTTGFNLLAVDNAQKTQQQLAAQLPQVMADMQASVEALDVYQRALAQFKAETKSPQQRALLDKMCDEARFQKEALLAQGAMLKDLGAVVEQWSTLAEQGSKVNTQADLTAYITAIQSVYARVEAMAVMSVQNQKLPVEQVGAYITPCGMAANLQAALALCLDAQRSAAINVLQHSVLKQIGVDPEACAQAKNTAQRVSLAAVQQLQANSLTPETVQKTVQELDAARTQCQSQLDAMAPALAELNKVHQTLETKQNEGLSLTDEERHQWQVAEAFLVAYADLQRNVVNLSSLAALVTQIYENNCVNKASQEAIDLSTHARQLTGGSDEAMKGARQTIHSAYVQAQRFQTKVKQGFWSTVEQRRSELLSKSKEGVLTATEQVELHVLEEVIAAQGANHRALATQSTDYVTALHQLDETQKDRCQYQSLGKSLRSVADTLGFALESTQVDPQTDPKAYRQAVLRDLKALLGLIPPHLRAKVRLYPEGTPKGQANDFTFVKKNHYEVSASNLPDALKELCEDYHLVEADRLPFDLLERLVDRTCQELNSLTSVVFVQYLLPQAKALGLNVPPPPAESTPIKERIDWFKKQSCALIQALARYAGDASGKVDPKIWADVARVCTNEPGLKVSSLESPVVKELVKRSSVSNMLTAEDVTYTLMYTKQKGWTSLTYEQVQKLALDPAVDGRVRACMSKLYKHPMAFLALTGQDALPQGVQHSESDLRSVIGTKTLNMTDLEKWVDKLQRVKGDLLGVQHAIPLDYLIPGAQQQAKILLAHDPSSKVGLQGAYGEATQKVWKQAFEGTPSQPVPAEMRDAIVMMYDLEHGKVGALDETVKNALPLFRADINHARFMREDVESYAHKLLTGEPKKVETPLYRLSAAGGAQYEFERMLPHDSVDSEWAIKAQAEALRTPGKATVFDKQRSYDDLNTELWRYLSDTKEMSRALNSGSSLFKEARAQSQALQPLVLKAEQSYAAFEVYYKAWKKDPNNADLKAKLQTATQTLAKDIATARMTMHRALRTSMEYHVSQDFVMRKFVRPLAIIGVTSAAILVLPELALGAAALEGAGMAAGVGVQLGGRALSWLINGALTTVVGTASGAAVSMANEMTAGRFASRAHVRQDTKDSAIESVNIYITAGTLARSDAGVKHLLETLISRHLPKLTVPSLAMSSVAMSLASSVSGDFMTAGQSLIEYGYAHYEAATHADDGKPKQPIKLGRLYMSKESRFMAMGAGAFFPTLQKYGVEVLQEKGHKFASFITENYATMPAERAAEHAFEAAEKQREEAEASMRAHLMPG